MKKISLVLVICCLAIFLASATWSKKPSMGIVDSTIEKYAYSGDESFHFQIFWTGGIKIGDLAFSINKDKEKRDTFTISAKVKDSGIFHFFYPVNDSFITVVEGEKKLPVRYNVEQQEGRSYHARRFTEYDQENGIVTYKKNSEAVKTFTGVGNVYNEFSSFLYTRILKLEKDMPVIVATFADKKRNEVIVHTNEKSVVDSALFGKVKVLVVNPVLKFKGLYDKRGDTTLYFTDDVCRVPVRIRSELLIGSITAELVSYSSSVCDKYSSYQLVFTE